MIDCMIVGDSIAVGTAVYRPECVSYSRGGWNSWQWNRDYLSIASAREYNTIIISLGANDHQYVKTEQELRLLRTNIKGARVFWILPNKKTSADIIERIAKEYNDTVLPIPELSTDKIHPTGKGYKLLGQQAK